MLPQNGTIPINHRIYTIEELQLGVAVKLSSSASHHISKVLRLKSGSSIILFNGDGYNYAANLLEPGKTASVEITGQSENHTESPVKTHLLQGVSRGDRMDFSIQKAVELGVSAITPILTEKTSMKLSQDRLVKKTEHWQKVIISACEQSGRSVVPSLHQPQKLSDALGSKRILDNDTNLVLQPGSSQSINEIDSSSSIGLLVGPESGLTNEEIDSSTSAGFLAVSLGPRTMRTETAGPAALTLIQYRFGDLATVVR